MTDSSSATQPTIARLPPSCVGWIDPFIGLIVIFVIFLGLRHLPLDQLSNGMLAFYMLAGTGIVLGAIEILRAPWRRQAPSSEPLSVILHRAGIKYIGFIAGMAFIGFLYWLFPEYRRPYYKHFFDLVEMVLPYIPFIFAFYFVYAEWRFPAEKDGSWMAGMFVLGRWSEIEWFTLQQNVLGWLVKGYFLPIMVGDMIGILPIYRYENWAIWELSFDKAFELLFRSLVSLELVFVVVGYAMGCRLFNSHIRAVENTMLGWVAALVTYGPFLSLTFSRYFDYRSDKIDWNHWLLNDPIMYKVWGVTIIVLMLIHMWCDACFGLRFSNLTHRGIVTNGCYRFCKHPAYLIKNVRWWMVSVPFISVTGFEDGLRNSLILGAVGLLYMVRCYAEERLLSRDPVYQEYGLWMDKHSWLSFVGRLVPFLSYEYRLNQWKKQGVLRPLAEGEQL